MAFDDATRRRLFKTVTALRNRLTEDFDEQLRSRYGIYADEGRVREMDRLTGLNDAEQEIARLLRERIDHLAAGGGRDAVGEAVHRIRREQAFTVLNRFAAIRMAEERGFVTQSVGGGMQSNGFRIFERTAGNALGSQYERYRTYLDCLFDELSLDLGVLFDRSDATGLLFPSESALRELFEILNDSEIAPLWAADETIGWIYQYYNDPEERKRMRKESAAPRNSRELAVRNQFFTPRYVVEFLTDNTLGRIWYEMTKGETRLKETCRYLVRRPNEIFLAEGQAPPTENGKPETDQLSQEELLRQPVHIPHRPLKDPREIRLLDPACGSMHFGLYAFDLFEAIYEEAWEIAQAQSIPGGADEYFSTFKRQTSEFPSREAFVKAVPAMIIEHNIHGVDIDPRAVQIAGLSLWLRAQKSWKAQEIKPADRPQVRRSNIVCAEPMPGSEVMLEDFIRTLDPPLLGALVKTVFDKMRLAGEAGTLLKIEEEIRTAIDEARQAWEKFQSRPSELFSTEELNQATKQPELSALEKSLTTGHRALTADFWETAEQQVIDALRAYAEQADTDAYQRRLFADDAARGFAFIDLCRKSYDAVVMNPPFGELAENTIAYIKKSFGDSSVDIYASFVSRANSMSIGRTLIGAIIPRSLLYYIDFYKFRENELYGKLGIPLCAELGLGVLDGATVRTIVSIFQSNPGSRTDSTTLCHRVIDPDKWETGLQEWAATPASGQVRCLSEFEAIPGKPLLLALSSAFVKALTTGTKLDPIAGKFHSGERTGAALIVNGLQTCDDFRFIRTWAEVKANSLSKSWMPLLKATDYLPFEGIAPLVVDWEADGHRIKEFIRDSGHSPSRYVSGEEHYPTRGVWYPGVCERGNCAAVVYGRGIPSRRGIAVIPQIEDLPADFLSGVLNSLVGCGVVGMVMPDRYRNPSYVGLVPVPSDAIAIEKVSAIAEKIRHIIAEFSDDELSARFVQATLTKSFSRSGGLLDGTERWIQKRKSAVEQIENEEAELDAEALHGIGVLRSDREILEEFSNRPSVGDWFAPALAKRIESAKSLSQYFLGTSFGRWDIRYATGEHQPPELPDPFDPLPVCPPGMLQNAEGLPAEPKDVPGDYPLRITWPGILVDDEGHPEDIVARVREAITAIWKDRADAIEQEACEILGVKAKPRQSLDALRVYFRDPNRFFKDHLARYSKSRRKAPIYWPISTESGGYTLWIYYHRLDSQTLYTCVNHFIQPKREALGREIEALRGRIGNEGSSEERQRLEDFVSLQAELKTLSDRLLAVAALPYRPDLNDGVQITAAPLWQCFQHKPWQKVLKQAWKDLEKGKYDWAHLALPIWPKRVVQACTKDRSLAIAHGLEDLLWVPDLESKRDDALRPLRSPEEEQKQLEKAGHAQADIALACEDPETAQRLGLRQNLWVQHPDQRWRRRLEPEKEIENESNRQSIR